jgi:hypothetical protein
MSLPNWIYLNQTMNSRLKKSQVRKGFFLPFNHYHWLYSKPLKCWTEILTPTETITACPTTPGSASIPTRTLAYRRDFRVRQLGRFPDVLWETPSAIIDCGFQNCRSFGGTITYRLPNVFCLSSEHSHLFFSLSCSLSLLFLITYFIDSGQHSKRDLKLSLWISPKSHSFACALSPRSFYWLCTLVFLTTANRNKSVDVQHAWFGT